jgi:hypothetical protein
MMKKITLFILLLLTFSFGYSQIIESFDPAPAVGVWVSNAGEPMTTVDVIDATVDFATYGKVGRMISDATGFPWQNAVLTMTANSIDITTTKTITANVYYSGGPINILCKLTEGIGQTPKERGVDHPGTGWSLLTWDFTVDTGEYNNISFFINRAAGGAWEGTPGSTVSREVWIDNITAPQGSAILVDAVPATGATDPVARATNDYKSFYNGIASPTGDEYVNEAGVNFNSFGGSTITGDIVLGDGNTVKKYKSHDYSGIGEGSYDVSAMENLHIDVWFDVAPAEFQLKLEDQTGAGGGQVIIVEIAPASGVWLSYDIDLSSFTVAALATLKWIIPVTPGTANVMYFDNIYFWKTAVDPVTDATLSDLKVDGTTITGFLPSKISYDFKVPTGTVTVPQITAATTTQAGASAVITQASGIPGAATVVVTASNSTTTKTYTVNIVEFGPPTDATTPPARAVADVASVYSNAYTNNVADGAPTTFAGASVVEQSIVDVNNKLLVLTTPNAGGGFQYGYFTPSATSFDLTNFTNFHVDFYVDGAVSAGQQFQIILQNFDGSNNFLHNITYNFDVNALGSGSWVSGDVLLSAFTNSSLARSGIKQIQIVCSGAPAFGPVYIDNIYFYKGTALSNKDFEIAGLNVYPNPARDSWTVKTQNINMSSIQVFDVLGKNVLSFKPNASEATINGSSLKAGLYFARINTLNGSSSLKLIKN